MQRDGWQRGWGRPWDRDEEPDAHVMHITRGHRQDHRPELNQVMLDVSVEHQAIILSILTFMSRLVTLLRSM